MATTAERLAPPARIRPPAAARGWLVGPWFDALFVANLIWPLVLLLQVGDGFEGRAGVQFWQVYFVTAPHRWITLALVFLDSRRFAARWRLFAGLAVASVSVTLGVVLTTGGLTCLLAVDYLWNAWHFAAQHHGIYRIYGRSLPPDGAVVRFAERWAMRLFLLYTILRVATVTWPAGPWLVGFLWADWFAAVVPPILLARDLARWRPGSAGRVLYLASVSVLYLSLLWAARERQPGLVLALATASALFHAVEYLALVSWSVQRRGGGMLGFLAPRWVLTLAAFALTLGAVGWLADSWFAEAWLTANVAVAFLHYAYDGIIWRRGGAGPVASEVTR